MTEKIDNGQDDWIGVDESVETIKVEKRKPILIEDMRAISAVVKKYQEKDYLIYRLDQAIEAALEEGEKKQTASVVSAVREIGKLIGHYEPDRKIVVSSNINSHADLSEEEMVMEARKIANRLKGID
jgi:hypothetical protein